MPVATIDGISTRYEVLGQGAPLLMFSPGGFDATLEKWHTLGVYAKTQMMATLTAHFQCIVFDRRETGHSGGRVQRITWADYAAQGKGLLDYLGISRAHLMGGCMGCAPVVAFAAAHPQATRSMVLYWPVGGAKYRINGQQRFAQHLAFVQQEGLAAVLALAQASTKSFAEDPRAGPWVGVLRHDARFAHEFLALDIELYKLAVLATQRALLDRDTAPGAEPEELLRLQVPALVVPGKDNSHATSAARYLEECLPRSAYWDIAPADQLAANVPARLLQFLAAQP
jgi:pimeloyl-ACP methyl ester carboxylesterase